ncbi:MAG: phosphate ABC transporter permease PstA [Myxococcota bacterium]
MTDPEATRPGARWAAPEMKARLARRNRAERRFQRLGLLAIGLAVASLGVLLASIAWRGVGAFTATEIQLDVDLTWEALGIDAGGSEAQRRAALEKVDFRGVVRDALRARFPEVTERREKRSLASLLSRGAGRALEERVLADPGLPGRSVAVWLPADDEVDLYRKAPEEATGEGRFTSQEIAWTQALMADGRLRGRLNTRFLTSGDSREPELAGIFGAVVGSALTLVVTLLLVFPLGVSAAVYLEEFAPRSRWTDLIEVNINNLAAVPSIVFGLLGLAVFLGTFNLPRSAPLVGGLTLALMTLPTIIITGRVSIQAVPPSIRQAARGLGASPLQVVVHHVLPLAMPGILTGTIIGMARALGETAPLLMIGMVAFVVDIPGGMTDAATALPVQIFLWADSPERAFVEKTSGAILVLLVFLIAMNGAAIAMRRRFEKRW